MYRSGVVGRDTLLSSCVDIEVQVDRILVDGFEFETAP
jgi:hypothetical protein